MEEHPVVGGVPVEVGGVALAAGVDGDTTGREVGPGSGPGPGPRVDAGHPPRLEGGQSGRLGHDAQVLGSLLLDLGRRQQGFDPQLSARLQGCERDTGKETGIIQVYNSYHRQQGFDPQLSARPQGCERDKVRRDVYNTGLNIYISTSGVRSPTLCPPPRLRERNR